MLIIEFTTEDNRIVIEEFRSMSQQFSPDRYYINGNQVTVDEYERVRTRVLKLRPNNFIVVLEVGRDE
jgi:hypothetical protein